MMSDLDPFAGLAKVLSALPGLPETVQLAALGTVCFLALVIAVVFLWPKSHENEKGIVPQFGDWDGALFLLLI